jgi:putative FmdB family regulatory protein
VPTYQYTCTDCGEPVEAVQKFSDDPLTVCPHCGGKLRKVFSPVGIVFKGSGFYRTDSRNGSSGDRAKKDKDKEPSGTGTKGSDSSSGGSSSSSGSSESSSSSGSSDSAASSSGRKKETKSSTSAAAAPSSS